MTPAGFLNLAWQTVVAPQDVARLLLSLRLTHEALLLAFATVVVLNALLFSLSVQMSPTASPLQPILGSPVIFMLSLGGSLAIVALAITWTGRALGGAGRIETVGLLLIWLQALRMLVQVAMLVLIPLSPQLGAFLAFAAAIAGVWILVNFIEVAHEFGSLFKSALVLLLGVTGMALGVSIIFSLIGVTTTGLAGYV
ncbi:YIP1 family protein [Aestuariicoccus sp. MJ-SS9]|uniref:YIP1 family protein n=1 Tax=Aestuariicoccus sp. MJ-SS9 TaxID=3079855 RepID=UPI0029103AF0|nr:YIP1 family protein [Aestuariicoccus sp. MJ-SS9]MDU8911019.1 YIP1 family protein [Aestuariicoccus sp. MJ-SS9]